MLGLLRFSMAVFAALVFAGIVEALPPINSKNIQIGEARYQLIHHGKNSGSMYYATRIKDGRYIVNATTTLFPGVRETASFAADAKTFAIRSVSVDGDFNRQILDAELVFSKGRLVGQYGVKKPDEVSKRKIAFDKEIPAGTIPRGVIFGIISGMPMDEGRVHEFKWFSALGGSVDDVKITVLGKETVTVPAGTFEVFRVDINAKPRNVAYITVTEPRLVVRIDVPGQDMRFERLADTD